MKINKGNLGYVLKNSVVQNLKITLKNGKEVGGSSYHIYEDIDGNLFLWFANTYNESAGTQSFVPVSEIASMQFIDR